jgi:hypothetical protein
MLPSISPISAFIDHQGIVLGSLMIDPPWAVTFQRNSDISDTRNSLFLYVQILCSAHLANLYGASSSIST